MAAAWTAAWTAACGAGWRRTLRQVLLAEVGDTDRLHLASVHKGLHASQHTVDGQLVVGPVHLRPPRAQANSRREQGAFVAQGVARGGTPGTGRGR